MPVPRFRPIGLLVGLISVLILGLAPSGAGAESPTAAIEGSQNGVYVGPGRTIDREAMAAVVSRARTMGIEMMIAVPTRPEPTASAFALRVRQAAELDVVLVVDAQGTVHGSVGDDHFDGFARAEKVARAIDDPAEAAGVFLTELTDGAPGGTPAIVGTLARWVFVFFVVVALATGAEVALRSRQIREPAT